MLSPILKLWILTITIILAGASVRAADVTLFDGKATASIVYDSDGGTPIAKAAELLRHDLTSLTSTVPDLSSNFDGTHGPAIIIGLAESPHMSAILKANHIDTSPIRGKWETYGRAVIAAPWDAGQKALVIFGSDTRGTIWGVIDLTREMGVSAWEWWADVTIRKVDKITVNSATY